MTPAQQAAEVIRLSEQATPGPWVAEHRHMYYTPDDDEQDGLGLEVVGPEVAWGRGQFARGADAQFIAYTRTAAPSIAQALLDALERVVQCQLALRTILDALPPHGRMNARDVQWLRSVARAGLGEDSLGAQLETAETARLRAEIDALRAVAEAAGDIAPPTTWSGRHHECRTCGMFADVEDAIMHTARCPYGRLQSALQRWKEVTW